MIRYTILLKIGGFFNLKTEFGWYHKNIKKALYRAQKRVEYFYRVIPIVKNNA